MPKSKAICFFMSFRMSSDDTVTRVSGEGPGPSPGGDSWTHKC
jgi:hypothetical protein